MTPFKSLTALLSAAILCLVFFTSTASAQGVDRTLAANPTATLNAIDNMNLIDLPDKTAGEVRGEIEAAIGLPEFWEIEKETVEAMHKDYAGRTNAGYEGYDQKKT